MARDRLFLSFPLAEGPASGGLKVWSRDATAEDQGVLPGREAHKKTRFQQNGLIPNEALRWNRSGTPCIRDGGLSGLIEASVAMHGFFLYTVLSFSGSSVALGPGEESSSLSLSLSPKPVVTSSGSVSFPRSSLRSFLVAVFSPAKLSLFLPTPSVRGVFSPSPSLPIVPRDRSSSGRCPPLSFSPR